MKTNIYTIPTYGIVFQNKKTAMQMLNSTDSFRELVISSKPYKRLLRKRLNDSVSILSEILNATGFDGKIKYKFDLKKDNGAFFIGSFDKKDHIDFVELKNQYQEDIYQELINNIEQLYTFKFKANSTRELNKNDFSYKNTQWLIKDIEPQKEEVKIIVEDILINIGKLIENILYLIQDNISNTEFLAQWITDNNIEIIVPEELYDKSISTITPLVEQEGK